VHGLQVNGVRIAWAEAGRGEAILLLHGLGGSHDDWRLQLPALAARHRVIVPDLRGFGASGRREPFTIQQHARDMLSLVAALDIRRAHVVGLSMGGAVAIQMALLKPVAVASLVLANTAPSFRLTSWERRRMAWLRTLIASVLGVGTLARITGRGFFPKRGQGRLRRRLIRHASETNRWVYLATLRALTRWNAAPRLKEIRAPTLVLGAEFDMTTTAEKRQWAARLPHARVVELPGSRHHSEQDSPERFNREVLGFIRSQSVD
jgi:pimeloyl-ACP methyl ester carboxylesterase